MRSRSVFAGVALAMTALCFQLPATADTAAAVVATDGAGDANFVNSNQLTNVSPTSGPDTRPASIDGADITQISFSTPYFTTKVLNPDGTVKQVLYTATGFRATIETQGNVLPTFGPSLIFRILTNIGGCDAWFEAVVQGSNAAAATDPQRADVRIPAACTNPTRTAAVVTSGFSIDVTGKVITMNYPFEAFTGASVGGLIQVGTQIDPDGTFTNNSNAPHVRTWVSATAPAPVGTSSVTAPTIDETPRPEVFVVGSDVPQSVVCSANPTHPDCQA
ncbi:MAG TPA: hypothetical protein VGB51_09470 [Actinomycetota bacterium]